MSIAYVDGATGDASFAPATCTIPVSVTAGDILLIFGVNIAGTLTPDVTISSTGTAPSPLIAPVSNVGAFMTAGAWWCVAGAGDPGATLTVGTTTGANYSGVAVVAYSGASASQPDVVSSGFGAASTTFTTPAATTSAAGDWAVWYAGMSGSSSFSSSPGTERQTSSSNRSFVADSNGSVGGSGTAIGGGTWTNGFFPAWVGFTIGLKLAGGGTAHTATASLAVTPSFSAARTRGTYRTGSLTATPSFSASRVHGHYRTSSLTVAPSFSASRTRGTYRTGSLAVAPSFAASRARGKYRTAALAVAPAFRAVPSGGTVTPAVLFTILQARHRWTAGPARNM